jgi:eukaryotic-like serine/threonine-protein kinase
VTDSLYAQRYRLVEALRPGRALAVHRALDPQGRTVRITVLQPYDGDAFQRQMGAVAAARHLDLPAVFDVGRDGLDCFVVTEDVEGTDALALVARGSLPVSDASMIGAQAAAGLAALHAQGVVHGGIGPEQVVKTPDGTVKLTGAGLAGGYPQTDLRPGAPAAGAHYLSPEEAQGTAIEPASDVYRLGLVLYLMLTGTHVFDGPDARTVAQEHIDGVVQPPQLRNPDVPPAIAQVVLRTLDKDPMRRGSAAQLQADLSSILGSAQVDAAPPPQKPKNRGWIWALGVLVVVAIAVLAALWSGGVFKSDTPATAAVTVPDVVGMTQSGATNALLVAKLAVGPVTEVQTTNAPGGSVVTQDPAAGSKAPEGTKVALTVAATASPSPTASTLPVPGVVGESQATAQTQLIGAGFVVVVSRETSTSVPSGDVISQSPSGGVVAAAGTTVTIVISTGAPTASPTVSATP